MSAPVACIVLLFLELIGILTLMAVTHLTNGI